MASSPTLITPSTSTPKPLITPIRSKLISSAASVPSTTTRRREFLSLAAGILSPSLLLPATSAFAASDEEYVKEASEVIQKVRSTLNMDKGDPNIVDSVAELREASFDSVAELRDPKYYFQVASTRLRSRPSIYSYELTLRSLALLFSFIVALSLAAPLPTRTKRGAISRFYDSPQLTYCFTVSMLAFIYSAFQLLKRVCDIAYRGVLISDMTSDYLSFILYQITQKLISKTARFAQFFKLSNSI